MAKFKVYLLKELLKRLTVNEILVMLNVIVFVLLTLIGYAHLVLDLEFHIQGFFQWLLITVIYGALSSLSFYYVFKREMTVDKVDVAKKSTRSKVMREVANGERTSAFERPRRPVCVVSVVCGGSVCRVRERVR